jgi:hypothetical protein
VYLENGHLYGLTEIEMAYLAGGVFGAATETVKCCSFFPDLYIDMRWQTAVAICTILMAAAHFPDEQVRVQDELDEIIGRKRGNSGFFASQLCRFNNFCQSTDLRRQIIPSSSGGLYL